MTFWSSTSFNDFLIQKDTSTPTIRLYTNFMTWQNSTFIELQEDTMEHLRRMWHANTERLPFRTPGSVPFLDLHMCLLLGHFFPKVAMFFSTFHLAILSWFCLEGPCCLWPNFSLTCFLLIFKARRIIHARGLTKVLLYPRPGVLWLLNFIQRMCKS